VASADLLLHPVRLRIIKAFLGDRALTTAQLAAELADVPPGSLYRHVARLTQAGILQVVAERRIRGAVERTYVLRLVAAQVGIAEAAAMTRDQHAQAFMAFVAGLLVDFDRYLEASRPAFGPDPGPDPRPDSRSRNSPASSPDPGPDLARDGVSYRAAAMWLTNDELADFLRDLAAVVQPRLANPPARGRRRRMVYSVLLPAPESAESLPGTGRDRPAPPGTGRDRLAPAATGRHRPAQAGTGRHRPAQEQP